MESYEHVILFLIHLICSTAKAIFEANTYPEILARVQPLKNRLKEWEHCVLTNQTADEDTDGFYPFVYLRLSHMTLELLLDRKSVV